MRSINFEAPDPVRAKAIEDQLTNLQQEFFRVAGATLKRRREE